MESSLTRMITIPAFRAFDPVEASSEHTAGFNFTNSPTRMQTLKSSRTSRRLLSHQNVIGTNAKSVVHPWTQE